MIREYTLYDFNILITNDIFIAEYIVYLCECLWALEICIVQLVMCSDKGASPVAQMVKEFACNAGDTGSIPGSGWSLGEGNGNPVQHACLGNPMNRGVWWATIHGITRFGYDLVTKPPPPPVIRTISSSVLVNDNIVQIIILI